MKVGDWVHYDGHESGHNFQITEIDQRGLLIGPGGFKYQPGLCKLVFPNRPDRRNFIDQQTPTERAISHAMHMVEAAGADPRLTRAVTALGEAFQHVADWTDAQGSVVPAAAPDAAPGKRWLPGFVTVTDDTGTFTPPVARIDKNTFGQTDVTSPLRVVPRTVKRNESVIACLEKMLASVKTENITGIGIAVVNAEGESMTNFESGENIATLIGCVCRLQKRLLEYQETI